MLAMIVTIFGGFALLIAHSYRSARRAAEAGPDAD